MRAGIVLAAVSLFAGCVAPWERPYPESDGPPNLTADVQMEDKPLATLNAILEIYEERPECTRYYLGSYYMKDQGKNALSLPIGKEVVIFFVRRERDIGHAESDDSSVRLQVRAGDAYRVSYRERNGSQETLFQIKKGDGQFRELTSLPPRDCRKFKVLNLR